MKDGLLSLFWEFFDRIETRLIDTTLVKLIWYNMGIFNKVAGTVQRVSQQLSGTSHGNPDIVKNVTVFAAVLGTAGGASHVLS